MKILITDGNCRSALSVTRSLGSKGLSVVVGEEFSDNLSATSKFCYKSYIYPSPYIQPRSFLDRVHKIIVDEDIDLVLPMTDVTMEIILANYTEFDKRLLKALPRYSSYSQVTNKINLLKLAETIGMQIPKSIIIKNKKALVQAMKGIIFPVIVKPARSKLYYNGGFLATSVSYVESKEQLLQLYEQKEYLKKPFIIQKIIQGQGAGIFAVFKQGKPLAFFCHERLREKPPSGGVSVLCRSAPINQDLKDNAEKLLKAVKWNGAAMVEFKIEDETGIPYLMEVNGRFWGSLQLAVDSGVDFPYLLYLMSQNNDLKMVNAYQVGKKSRWLLGDLDHLYFRIFKKTGNEGLPSDSAAKVRAIYDFLKYNGKDCTFDVLRWKDIMPFVTELKQYVRRAN